MKKLLISILFVPALAFASGAELHLDHAPDRSGDKAALQNGRQGFCQLLSELPLRFLHALQQAEGHWPY